MAPSLCPPPLPDHPPLFPPSSAGWFLAHEVLRRDDAKLIELLSALLLQAELGVALTAAQRRALSALWDCINAFFHRHHDSEDEVVIPYLRDVKKVPVTTEIVTGHAHLIKALDACTAAIHGTVGRPHGADAASDAAVLGKLLDDVKALNEFCEGPYKIEETEVLPLLRQHATPAEVLVNVSLPIWSKQTPMLAGQFWSCLTPQERSAFMAQENVPWKARWVIKVLIWKHRRGVTAPVDAAIHHATVVSKKARK